VVCKRIELFIGRIGHIIEFYVVGFYPSNSTMGLHNIDVVVVLLEVAGITAGIAGVCSGLRRMGQLSTA
jgi:hypothetical protein